VALELAGLTYKDAAQPQRLQLVGEGVQVQHAVDTGIDVNFLP